MFDYYRTPAFILSKKDLKDSDQVFSLYSKNYGMIEVLGKSIRKIKSKLRSGADVFYYSNIEFINGRGYKTLTGVELKEKYNVIRNDLPRLKIAYKISEDLISLIKGQEEDDKIFNLIDESFRKLNDKSLSLDNCLMVYYYFFWNLVSNLGYKMDLYNCVSCQNKLVPSKLYFCSDKKGVECPVCFNEVERGEEVSPEVIKLVRVFNEKSMKDIFKTKKTQQYIKPLNNISEKCLQFLIT